MAKKEKIILYLLVIAVIGLSGFVFFGQKSVGQVADELIASFGGASHFSDRIGTQRVEFGQAAVVLASASSTDSFVNNIRDVRGQGVDIIVNDIVPQITGTASSTSDFVWAWATSTATTTVGSLGVKLPEPVSGSSLLTSNQLVGLWRTATGSQATTTSIALPTLRWPAAILKLPVVVKFGEKLDFRLYHRSNVAGNIVDGASGGTGYNCQSVGTCIQSTSTSATRGFDPAFILKYSLIYR